MSPYSSANRWLPQVLIALALVVGNTPSSAQVVIDQSEHLDFDRPEAWAMRYGTAAILLGNLGPITRAEPGSWHLGLEGGWIPSLSEAQRTVGFNGIKEEDLNKSPAFGRIRLEVGLPAGIALTLAALPPVEVEGVEPKSLGVSLARPLVTGDRLSLGARLHGQWAELAGDFSCSADIAGNPDPVVNPFRCRKPSDDTYRSLYGGLELQLSGHFGKLAPYLAVSYLYQDLETEVRAVYSTVNDHSTLTANGSGRSFTVGAALTVSPRFSLAAEAVWVPLGVVRPPRENRESDDLINVRGLLRYRLR